MSISDQVVLFLNRLYTRLKRSYYEKLAKAKIVSSKNARLGKNIHFYGRTVIKIDSDAQYVDIGDNFICRSGSECGVGVKTSKIQVGKNARLIIGNDSGISNTNIACTLEIRIGNNVNIGFDTTIMDSDFHSTSPTDRLNHTDIINAKSKSIIIHDNVFIGAGCIIMKGVEIGENAVIAAGSIVTSNIPANELWGGNIARKIRDL